MAAGPSTLAKVDNILKEVYLPGINDQLQSETVTLKRIKSTTKGISPVGGKYVRFATKMARNHGIGARLENEGLPAARVPTWADGTLALSYQYGALQLTGQTLDLADSDPQAFASALEQHMSDLKENLAKDMNRQVYGTSTGIIATADDTLGGAHSTTVMIVTTNRARNIEEDMYLDLWDASLAAFDANGPFTVTSVVDNAAGYSTVTFSPAAANAVADGDTFRRAGASIDATTGKELIGFGEIISDSGTLHGINPATYNRWKATVDSNGGTNRALSEGLMNDMMIQLRRKGARPSVIFTTPELLNAYFGLLSQQREFVNTQKFEGGYSTLAYNFGGNIPVVDDVDCPGNRMYFVSEKELRLYSANDWNFLNRDGSNWARVQSDGTYYDAWVGHMRKYCNLATLRRNSHGLLSDITEP